MRKRSVSHTVGRLVESGEDEERGLGGHLDD